MTRGNELLVQYHRKILGLYDQGAILEATVTLVQSYIDCDSIRLVWKGGAAPGEYSCRGPAAPDVQNFLPLEIQGDSLTLAGKRVTTPLIVASASDTNSSLQGILEGAGVHALAILPLRSGRGLEGWLEAYSYRCKFSWPSDSLKTIAQLLDYCALLLVSIEQDDLVTPVSTPRILSKVEDAVSMEFELALNGKIIRVSRGAELFVGSASSSLIGQSIHTILLHNLVDVYREEARRSLDRVINGEAKWCEFFAEIDAKNEDGTRHFLFQAKRRGDGRQVQLIITDVTDGSFYRHQLDEARLRSRRLVEYGNIIIVKTDKEFRITDILGEPQQLVGISAQELLNDPKVWRRLLEFKDFAELAKAIRAMGANPRRISSDICIRHHDTNKCKWLLVNAVPLISPKGVLVGWEGFAFDITEKRRVEEELREQRKRLAALYEISSALVENVDPAFITLRGLRALIRATGAHGGFVVLGGEQGKQLEISAAQGLSLKYVENFGKVLNSRATLVRHALEERRTFLLKNVQTEPLAYSETARFENLRATIVVPMAIDEGPGEGRVVGAIALFCHSAGSFSKRDLDLVMAAAAQIALVVQRAEYYTLERRQADSLAALYRLSHELSQVTTAAQAFDHARPIIESEFACKRLWLGTINEQGTHLMGQGGGGPGLRQSVIELQIELKQEHKFLDQVLEEKQAIIVDRQERFTCPDLGRLLERLELGTFAIVPLIVFGNVTGVLVLEPAHASVRALRRKLPLLSSMASELAMVLWSRRMEAKLAESARMRMAGVLSGGVAHNFNNLLQAIMGQAALIEMQLPEGDPLSKAARTIIGGAEKGAALTKQMLALTREGISQRRIVDVRDIVTEARNLCLSLLGGDLSVNFMMGGESAPVSVDPSQIQQVITNLLVNARDAVGGKSGGVVTISEQIVQVGSGEVHPELAPGSYVRIDVQDNGVGMTSEELVRCFDPFFTTKNIDYNTGLSFTGSGLGLSLSYSIMKQHGGLLTATATAGEGALFSMYLPLIEPIDDKTESSTMGDSRGCLILSSADLKQYLVQPILESFGFYTRVVEESSELGRVLAEHSERAALVVLDLDQLDVEVIDLLRSLERWLATRQVLAVTSRPERWQRLLRSLAWVQVEQKPLKREVLRAVVAGLPKHLSGLRGIVEKVEHLRLATEGTPAAQQAIVAEGSLRRPSDE